MEQTKNTHVIVGLTGLLVLLLTTQPGAQDLQSDTTAIRAILQANGIPDTVQIREGGTGTTPPRYSVRMSTNRVVSVNLSGLGLTDLTSNVVSLDQLSTINFEDNDISTLPPEIENLSQIAVINGQNNNLTSLPPEIGNLIALTHLNLSGNQISALPPEIGNLTQPLTDGVFNFSNNQLTSLPSTFGNIGSSAVSGGGEMNLSDNQLTSLPASATGLKVGFLRLNNNQITALPDEICDNTRISNLELNNNRLTALPDCIGGMSNMSRLRLDDNQIAVLPPSFVNLSDLRFVYLRNNELESLPSGINNMTVSDFYIGGNRLCPGNYSEPVENWLDFNADDTAYWKTTQRCGNPVIGGAAAGALFSVAQYAGRLEVWFAEGVRVEGVELLDVKGKSGGVVRLPEKEAYAWNVAALPGGVYVVRAVTDKGVLIRKTVIHEQ